MPTKISTTTTGFGSRLTLLLGKWNSPEEYDELEQRKLIRGIFNLMSNKQYLKFAYMKVKPHTGLCTLNDSPLVESYRFLISETSLWLIDVDNKPIYLCKKPKNLPPTLGKNTYINRPLKDKPTFSAVYSCLENGNVLITVIRVEPNNLLTGSYFQILADSFSQTVIPL